MLKIAAVVVLSIWLAACDVSRPAADGRFHARSTMAVDVVRVSDVVLEGSAVVNHVQVLTIRMPNGREGEILMATDEPVSAGDRVKIYEFSLRNPFASTELPQTEPISLAIRVR